MYLFVLLSDECFVNPDMNFCRVNGGSLLISTGRTDKFKCLTVFLHGEMDRGTSFIISYVGTEGGNSEKLATALFLVTDKCCLKYMPETTADVPECVACYFSLYSDGIVALVRYFMPQQLIINGFLAIHVL